MRNSARRSNWASPRSGITLLDYLVVIATVLVITAILIPAIVAAREAARASQCRDNLKQIGKSMHIFATVDADERFLSGAFDSARSGCVDTYGWPADMAFLKTGRASDLLCPSNEARGSETLLAAIGGSSLPAGSLSVAGRKKAGYCVSTLADTNPTTYEFMDAYLDTLQSQGVNTNYATAWYAGNGQMLTQPSAPGSTASVTNAYIPSKAPGALRDPMHCTGLFTRLLAESSNIPSNAIPIMADAARSERDLASLPLDLKYSSSYSNLALIGRFVDPSLKFGEPLAKTQCDGPVFILSGDKAIRCLEDAQSGTSGPETALIPQAFPAIGTTIGMDVSKHEKAQSVYASTEAWGSLPAGTLVLQDTRAWAPQHGDTANVLMADGSVRMITDENRDGFFNPGFQKGNDTEANLRKTNGYIDGLVEICSYEIFCGVLLNNKALIHESFD